MVEGAAEFDIGKVIAGDIETRDKVWAGLLPTERELLDPEGFISSTEIPDDLSGLI